MVLKADVVKVLLCEDQPVVRHEIQALLNLQEDLEVIGEAVADKEAIRKAEELRPDVLLMDISTSGFNNLGAVRSLKKRLPGIKVLIISQCEDRECVLSAFKSGADGYVPRRAVWELAAAIRTLYQGDSFLSPSAATALIEYHRKNPGTETLHSHLRKREQEILPLVVAGHTSREIAGMLSISLKTVQMHRYKMMGKLDIHNQTELVKYAVRNRLVQVGA